MATQRIWLVRHGQSRSQTGESLDHLNPPLSALGQRQAECLVEPLQDLALDCILVSPLRRAWHTFQLARVQADHVAFDSRLIESDWGEANRYAPILPVSTPEIALPDQQNAWLHPVYERARSLVQTLAVSNWQTVLLFGHWGVFSRLFLAFAGLDVRTRTFTATMNNAAVSLLEVDEDQRRYVRYWNRCDHVMDLLS